MNECFAFEPYCFCAADGGVEELGDGVDAVDGDFADGPEETVIDFVANLKKCEERG